MIHFSERSARSWLWITISLLLGSVLFIRGCSLRLPTDLSGSDFNQGANAAWLSVDWVDSLHEKDKIAILANDLKKREMRYVFVFASYLKSNGEFNPTYTHAAEFTSTLRTLYPDLNIQAWIGLPLTRPWFLGEGHGHVDLSDAATRRKIAAFCADLIRLGKFDGIHVDPEPVPSGDADLLKLLHEIRSAIGLNPSLSIATRRIQPIFSEFALPVTSRVAWSADYYQEVAKRVDQVAVMTYDSGLPLPQLYRQWVRFQVVEISQKLYEMNVDVFIGVPTSEEKTRTHRPRAENITSGLQGVIDGLNDVNARPSIVTGVAVYPYWDTEPTEWAVYEALWLGR